MPADEIKSDCVVTPSREPVGDFYLSLLEFLFPFSERFSLDFGVGPREPRNWPIGTQLAPYDLARKPSVHRSILRSNLLGSASGKKFYSCGAASLQIVRSATQCLFSWQRPYLPEDLVLYRSDGSVLLGTVAHEYDWWVARSNDQAETRRFDEWLSIHRGGDERLELRVSSLGSLVLLGGPPSAVLAFGRSLRECPESADLDSLGPKCLLPGYRAIAAIRTRVQERAESLRIEVDEARSTVFFVGSSIDLGILGEEIMQQVAASSVNRNAHEKPLVIEPYEGHPYLHKRSSALEIEVELMRPTPGRQR